MNHFKKNKGPNTVGQRPNEELWTRTGTFVNKPQKGWLHAEEKVKQGGVCYGVTYVGCIEVKQSMRTLPFEMRGQVTKEAIFRVCDAAGFRYNRKKKGSKSVNKILGDVPNIQFGGANVNLTISTSSITLTIMETGQVIASHQMQGISFASGGDAETAEYVAYVGKDPVNGRACHVLECLGGLAQDTITTIGQAFEIRFKDYLRNPPQAVSAPDRLAEPIFGEEESAWGDDPEYYNDISKFANLPPQEPFPPPPPPGQYMRCQSVPENHPYQPLGAAKPSAPLYDNREGAFESRDQHMVNNQRQAAVGKLLDIDDTPQAPALDNPLSNQVRRVHSIQGSHTRTNDTSSETTTFKSVCDKKPSPVKHFKRCTPVLYDNPPQNIANKKVNEIAKHKSSSPDWRGILEAGYDNLRIPWNRSRKGSKCKSHKAGNSIYDEPRFDGDNYDNPKVPLVPPDSDFPEGMYNVPTPNQPLNLRMPHNGQQHPSPVVDAFDMEPFNPAASLPKDPMSVPPPPQFSNSTQASAPPPAPQPRARISPPVQQATPPPQSHAKPGIPPPPSHKPPPPPIAQPRGNQLAAGVPPRNSNPAEMSSEQPKKSIQDEEWFHGPMTRKIGEALLDEDGDFLVRESTTTPGQYVLSGMLSGQPKHLLLVDPQGRVRTKDKVFESVSHLINYHRNNKLPIISGGSHVYLQHPVLNAAAAGKHYN